MYNIIYINICEIVRRQYRYFGGMRYLDFSTPKSVMRSIFFEVFISVRGVYGGGGLEVGILIVLLSAGEGKEVIVLSRISYKCTV